jgi:hypothetical protein
MKARLGGTDRDVEGAGDLGEGPALDVMQNEKGTLIHVESLECKLQSVLLGHRILESHVAWLRRSIVVESDVADAVPRPSTKREATRVHDDPVRPSGEARHISEGGQLQPDRNQSLLDGIVRVCRLAEDRTRDAADRNLSGSDQLRERFDVATTGALDELVDHRPSRPDRSATSSEYEDLPEVHRNRQQVRRKR